MTLKNKLASVLLFAAKALGDKPAKEVPPIERLHNELEQGVKALEADRNEKHKAAKAAESQFESNDAMLNRATALARRAATLRVEANVAVKMTDEFKQLITQQEQEALDAYCDMQSLGVAHLVSVDEHQIEEDYRRSFASRASSRFASRSEAQSAAQSAPRSAAQSAPQSAKSAPPSSGTDTVEAPPPGSYKEFSKTGAKARIAKEEEAKQRTYEALVAGGVPAPQASKVVNQSFRPNKGEDKGKFIAHGWAQALIKAGRGEEVERVAEICVTCGFYPEEWSIYLDDDFGTATQSTSGGRGKDFDTAVSTDVDDDETDFHKQSTIGVNTTSNDAGNAAASGGTSVLDSNEVSQTRRQNATK